MKFTQTAFAGKYGNIMVYTSDAYGRKFDQYFFITILTALDSCCLNNSSLVIIDFTEQPVASIPTFVGNNYTVSYKKPKPEHLDNAYKHHGKQFLHINCYNDHFDIHQIVKLINFGVRNKGTVCNRQQKYPYDSYRYGDTLRSLSTELIDSIINADAVGLEKFYKNRFSTVYRSSVYDTTISLEYYFQYGKCNVFLQDSKNEHAGPVLISVDHIEHMFSDKRDHFIFTSDSTFYHINDLTGIKRGPFHIWVPELNPYELSAYKGKMLNKNIVDFQFFDRWLYRKPYCYWRYDLQKAKQAMFPHDVDTMIKLNLLSAFATRPEHIYNRNYAAYTQKKQRRNHIVALTAAVVLLNIVLIYKARR